MTFTVKTIPDMLLEAYGNQSEVARILNCNRATVRKYIGDKEGKKARRRQWRPYGSSRMG
ncbi:phage NinH family protein [Escherichia coli]|nr:phage NinH family protein [Escherichia coli]